MSPDDIRADIKARRWKLELDEMFDGSVAAVIYGPLYNPSDARPKYGFASAANEEDAIIQAYEHVKVQVPILF